MTDKKLDLSLTEKSKKDLEQFLQLMKQIESTTGRVTKVLNKVTDGLSGGAANIAGLRQTLKDLDNLTKALKARDIASAGPGAFVTGQRAQNQASIDRTIRAGTEQGQTLSRGRRAREVLREEQQLLALDRARNVNLRERVADIRRINDLSTLQAKLEDTKLRKGIAITENRRGQIRDADRLIRALEKQAELVALQAKFEAQAARISNQRTARVNRAAQFDPALEDARIQGSTARRNYRRFGTTSAPPEFAMGEQVRNQTSIANTNRLGTEAGIANAGLRQVLADAKLGVDLMKNRVVAQEALNLRLNTSAAQIQRINSLEQANTMLKAAQLRQGLELVNGNTSRAKSAERITGLLQQQVEALKAQAAEEKRLQREATARQRQIERLRNPDRELDDLRNQRGRRQMIDRVTGDGGASLLAIQAQLSANYAVIGGLQGTVANAATFTAELDNSLRNLQAITVTTEGNMQGLKDTIVSVGQQTKFSAVEVAEAATTLGQAGLSADQIQRSLSAVALLATATGTDLAQAVDVASSTLGVFELDAEQMGYVANTLTTAVNESKLNIDKLALGIQYAGNTAAQTGVTMEELTASLGAMANAGIRSGSTLGTGMRQILISLQKPSETFLATLDRLGLTMADVDLASNGVYGALKNLKDAGFTASDAIQSFEIRGAAAFTALSGNLDEMLRMEQAFVNSTAATKANATQMESFTNTASNFQGALQSVIEVALQPFMLALRDAMQFLTDVLEKIREYPNAIRLVGGALTALAVAWVAAFPVRLIGGMVGLAGAAGGIGTAAAGAAGGVRLLAGALRFIPGPIGLITTALSIGVGAFFAYRSSMQDLQDSLDKAQSSFDNASGAMEAQASKIGMVDNEIQTLLTRYETLSKNQALLDTEIAKVRTQFVEMGFDVNRPITSVDELIATLRELRGELSQDYTIKINQSAEALELVMKEREALIAQQRQDIKSAQLRFKLRSRGQAPSSGFNQLLTEMQNPNLDAQQLERLRLNAERMQSTNAANLAAGGLENRERNRIKLEQEILADLLANTLTGLVENLTDQARDKIDRQNLVTRNRVARESQRPEIMAIQSQTGLIRAGVRPAIGDAVRGIASNDPIARGEAASAAQSEIEGRLNAIRRNLATVRDQIDPSLYEQLRNEIDATQGEILAEIEPFVSEMNKERGEQQKRDIEKLSADLDRAREKFSGSQNLDDLSANLSEASDLIVKAYQARVDAINSGDGTVGAKADAIAAEDQRLADELNALGQEATTMGQGFETKAIDTRIRGLETILARVREQRETASRGGDSAGVAAAAERETALIQQIASLTEEKLRIEQTGNDLIVSLGELSQQTDSDIASVQQTAADQQKQIADQRVQELKAKLSELKNEAGRIDERLAREMETARPELIDTIQQQRMSNQIGLQQQAQAIFEQIKALGVQSEDSFFKEFFNGLTDTIRGIAEEGDALKAELAATSAEAAAAAREAEISRLEQVEADANEAFENAIALADAATNLKERNEFLEIALEQANAALKAGLARVALTTGGGIMGKLASGALNLLNRGRTAAISAYQNSKLGSTYSDFEGGGRGGGGGGGTKEDEVDLMIKDLKGRLQAAEIVQMAGGTSNLQAQDITSKVNAKIKEINAELTALESRMRSGTLTSAEQERLNTLVDQHGKLTSFVRGEQERIVQLMIQQGQYGQAILATTQQWAQQNLNLGNVLTSGVTGALGTVKSAMTDMFTAWSDGTKSGKQAFRDFAISVVKAIQNIIAEMIAVAIMKRALGWLAGAIGIPDVGAPTMREGGEVKRFDRGGPVEGNLQRDSQRAILMPGEYVLRKSAAQAIGYDALDQMNAMGNRVESTSGHRNAVQSMPSSSLKTNVWVVAPDRQPVPGPNDIIATINDDILKNGSTKKLIKSVAMGSL